MNVVSKNLRGRLRCTCGAVRHGNYSAARFKRRHPKLCTERAEFAKQLAASTRHAEAMARKRQTPLLDQLTAEDEPNTCSISRGGKEWWKGTTGDLKRAAATMRKQDALPSR